MDRFRIEITGNTDKSLYLIDGDNGEHSIYLDGRGQDEYTQFRFSAKSVARLLKVLNEISRNEG